MKIKVGVIQDSPVFFDLNKTILKIESIVKKYAAAGCQLLVFPESFIPGYPRGFDFGAVIGSRKPAGRELYLEYYSNSLDLKSSSLRQLEKIAHDNDVYLVIGTTEKNSLNGSLYCSMLYLSPKVGLMGVHRKIKPTGTERLIWAESDSSGLIACDTAIGRMGGLICWENYMPLARMSIYNAGVQIYIAPTADARDQWTATMRHIALECRCFVIGCNQYMTKSMYPKEYQSLIANETEDLCRGGSIIVSPLGEIIEGPLFDQSGALTTVIDLDDIIRSKLDFDVIGHYARPDIFQFRVKDMPAIIQENQLSPYIPH